MSPQRIGTSTPKGWWATFGWTMSTSSQRPSPPSPGSPRRECEVGALAYRCGMTSSTPTSSPTTTLAEDATAVLRRLVGREDATFRDGQLEAIDALVDGGRRVLVVQRTGWGKSAVYFVASRLQRAKGAGPALIVSPLLALMRDQIAAAERAGVRAVSMNSSNAQEW